MPVKDSTHDRIEGTAKQARGKIKVAAGKLTKNTGLKARGVADQIEGKVQKKIGDREKARGR